MANRRAAQAITTSLQINSSSIGAHDFSIKALLAYYPDANTICDIWGQSRFELFKFSSVYWRVQQRA
jgi:hypothetical protein